MNGMPLAQVCPDYQASLECALALDRQTAQKPRRPAPIPASTEITACIVKDIEVAPVEFGVSRSAEG